MYWDLTRPTEISQDLLRSHNIYWDLTRSTEISQDLLISHKIYWSDTTLTFEIGLYEVILHTSPKTQPTFKSLTIISSAHWSVKIYQNMFKSTTIGIQENKCFCIYLKVWNQNVHSMTFVWYHVILSFLEHWDFQFGKVLERCLFVSCLLKRNFMSF